MPLQNRVTPMGDIVAAPERGSFTGNRGIIHDPQTRMLLNRRWACHTWLICRLQWRGVRRSVMGTRSWTELTSPAADLPDGTMILQDWKPHLILGGLARAWSFRGYGPPVTPFDGAQLITPPS